MALLHSNLAAASENDKEMKPVDTISTMHNSAKNPIFNTAVDIDVEVDVRVSALTTTEIRNTHTQNSANETEELGILEKETSSRITVATVSSLAASNTTVATGRSSPSQSHLSDEPIKDDNNSRKSKSENTVSAGDTNGAVSTFYVQEIPAQRGSNLQLIQRGQVNPVEMRGNYNSVDYVAHYGSTNALLRQLSPRPPISNANAHSRLLNPPSLVTYRSMGFLILDAPSDANLHLYLPEFVKNRVTDIVRACDRTYSLHAITELGIEVHELNFRDGDPPPTNIVKSWLELVAKRFLPASAGGPGGNSFKGAAGTIAVHCVAGLGRAPVLVAIALVEAGMPPLQAVEYIRARRRGALNMKQIRYLDTYKRRGRGRLNGLPAPAPNDTVNGLAKSGSNSTVNAISVNTNENFNPANATAANSQRSYVAGYCPPTQVPGHRGRRSTTNTATNATNLNGDESSDIGSQEGKTPGAHGFKGMVKYLSLCSPKKSKKKGNNSKSKDEQNHDVGNSPSSSSNGRDSVTSAKASSCVIM